MATPYVAARQSETVACAWRLTAETAVGPETNRTVTGLLTVDIEPDGAIPSASLEVDATAGETPEVFAGVGTSTGRRIELRLVSGDCATLTLTGVAVDDVSRCDVMIDGLFRGVSLSEVGGWRGAPVGLCPEGAEWDGVTCGCVTDCVEQTCPAGEVWRASECVCACAPEECDDEDGWSWSACACVPKSGGGDPAPGATATATPGGIMVPTSVANPACPYDLNCPAPKIKDASTCTCVCPPTTCAVGRVLDQETCTCKFPVLCLPEPCPEGESWMPDLCTCSQHRCTSGDIWCYTQCIDPKYSKNNCGSCGNVCANQCIGGFCV